MKERLKSDVKKARRMRILLILLCVVLLFSSVGVCAVGTMIEKRYKDQIPLEMLTLSAKGAPPRIFFYRYTDRKNRIGEREELKAGAFSQPQSSYVCQTELPKQLTDAFVAIEDKRFYRHRGVDWRRTVAAAISYVLGFSNTFGGSTITQQTVKNVTGDNSLTVSRKLREIFCALELERRCSKREILELYLNVISFSDGCEGVSQAAAHYFSKTPDELTVAECATIAAITNNPSYYNPIRHPENNLKRRDLILSEMQKQGYLSQDAYQEALAEPLRLRVGASGVGEEIHSWYVDMVIEDVINDLIAQYGVSRSAASMWVHSGGLRIDAAIDPEIQELVETHYESAVRTPQNGSGESAQSALIVIDSQTGDILGVAGAVGKKTANRIQNFATQALRSPGSAIKPITVYAQALERGLINWATVYDDVPVSFGTSGARPWPANATGIYRGLTNIAYAVAHSTNTVAVRVLEQIGLRESFTVAREKFHLTHLVDREGVSDCDVAALALGQLNYGITLRELTTAYTVFADGGCYHPWRSYHRVTDADGKVLLFSSDSSEIVMSEGNAAVMTKLLQGVVRDGTSSSITLQKVTECAGKTGTTQNDGDRWFVGYTPDLICGVWCGYEYPEPLVGSNLCTGIWNTVMRQIVAHRGGRTEFSIPSNVVERSYCRDSGMLCADACLFDPRGDRTQTGWFVSGNEPRDACTCHILCHADSEHGGIDCGLCPDLLKRQVSLIRVERHFPMQILVSDAQYVYRGDPYALTPSSDPRAAYFEATLSDFCGRSHTTAPFNRACSEHREE